MSAKPKNPEYRKIERPGKCYDFCPACGKDVFLTRLRRRTSVHKGKGGKRCPMSGKSSTERQAYVELMEELGRP